MFTVKVLYIAHVKEQTVLRVKYWTASWSSNQHGFNAPVPAIKFNYVICIYNRFHAWTAHFTFWLWVVSAAHTVQKMEDHAHDKRLRKLSVCGGKPQCSREWWYQRTGRKIIKLVLSGVCLTFLPDAAWHGRPSHRQEGSVQRGRNIPSLQGTTTLTDWGFSLKTQSSKNPLPQGD